MSGNSVKDVEFSINNYIKEHQVNDDFVTNNNYFKYKV